MSNLQVLASPKVALRCRRAARHHALGARADGVPPVLRRAADGALGVVAAGAASRTPYGLD